MHVTYRPIFDYFKRTLEANNAKKSAENEGISDFFCLLETFYQIMTQNSPSNFQVFMFLGMIR